MRKTWGRRLVRASAWGLLALLGLIALGYLLRNAVIAPLVIGEIGRRLKAEQGLTLSVESVDGNWFDHIELRGVDLRANEPDVSLRSLRIERVSLRFRALQLARGDIAALERIDGRGVALELDLDIDASDTQSLRADGGSGEWPKVWPAFDLTDVEVTLLLPGERVIQIRDSSTSGTRAALGHDVALDAREVIFEGDFGIALARERVRARGNFSDRAFQFDDVELEGDIVARSADLRVALAPRVEIGGELAALGGSVHFDSVSGEPQFATSWSADSIELDQLERLIAPSAAWNLTGRASGSGEVIVEQGLAWSTARGRVLASCVEGWTIDEFEFDVAHRPGVFEIARLEARRSAATLRAFGVSIPLDREGLAGTLRALRGRIEVDGLELHDASDVELPRHELALAGVLDDSGFVLERGLLTTDSGELRLQRGAVAWGPDEPSLFSGARYDIDLTTSFDDLAQLGALFDDREWAGRLSGGVHLSGTWSAPFGDIDLHGSDVICSGWRIGEVAIRAGTDGRRVSVDTVTIDGALGLVSAKGAYDLRSESLEEFSANATIPDVAVLMPDIARSGSLELTAELRGPWRTPLGVFDLRAKNLQFAEVPELAELNAAGELGADVVSFRTFGARFADADWLASGTWTHEAWAQPWTFDLATASVRRDQVEIELASACRIAVNGEDVSIPTFDLSGVGGKAHGTFSARSGDWQLQSTLTGLDPTPLAALFTPPTWEYGNVDGEFTLARAAGRWSGHGELDLVGLKPFPNGPSVALSIAGGFAGQRANLERFELRSEVGLRASLSGEFPFDEIAPLRRGGGTLQVAWDVAVEGLDAIPWGDLGIEHRFVGALTARGSVAGAWPDVRGSFELEADRCTVTPHAVSGVIAALALRDARLSARAVLDDGVVLQRFELRAPNQISLDVNGKALSGEAVRRILGGDSQAWRESELALSARWSIDDLSFLSSYWPALRRIGGSSTGKLTAGGTWTETETAGELAIHRGELRLDTELASFEQVEALARLSGEKLILETCSGELGAGPFDVDGEVDFSGEEPKFDLHVVGRELLAVQTREVRLRADVDVTLRGPASALVLAGDLRARDGRWVTNIDWYRPGSRRRIASSGFAPLFSIESGPFANMRFDLALRGGDPFRFETNVARGAVRADLSLAGTGREPELSGALFFEKASIFLSGTDLLLQSGTLTLDRRRPLSPDLDFTLTTRVRGYAITVRIEGNYDEPVVEFSSSPPLPGDDIIGLVLTQRAPGSDFAGDSAAAAAETVIVYLGRDLMSRIFGAESAVAERVEWQVGADVTQGGTSTAQLRIRVLGPVDGEGLAFYLRAERDTYDRINYGLRFVLRFR